MIWCLRPCEHLLRHLERNRRLSYPSQIRFRPGASRTHLQPQLASAQSSTSVGSLLHLAEACQRGHRDLSQELVYAGTSASSFFERTSSIVSRPEGICETRHDERLLKDSPFDESCVVCEVLRRSISGTPLGGCGLLTNDWICWQSVQELVAGSYSVGVVDDSIDLAVEELRELLELFFDIAKGAVISIE